MRRLFAILALGLFCFGCEDSQTEPAPAETESGDGINIEFPGGNVSIGKESGVDVEAPGVSVKAKDGEGVKVKAPGVDVDAEAERE